MIGFYLKLYDPDYFTANENVTIVKKKSGLHINLFHVIRRKAGHIFQSSEQYHRLRMTCITLIWLYTFSKGTEVMKLAR